LNFWTLLGVIAMIGAAALLYVGFDSTPRETLPIVEGLLLGIIALRCFRRSRPDGRAGTGSSE
jgi:uncharacterized membrane protein YfcA